MGYKKFSKLEKLLGVKCYLCAERVRGRENANNHHIDGNKHNNRHKNQTWICIKCHKKINKLQKTGHRKKQVADDGVNPVRVRENISGLSAKVRETTDTIMRGKIMRPLFDDFLFRRVLEGMTESQDIIDSFPMFLERVHGLKGWGSDRGAERYLRYHCSSEGLFKAESTPSGLEIIKFKDEDDYERFKDYHMRSVEELDDE